MKKILVVDDSQSAREIVRVVLKGAGYEVLVAPDGYTALKILTADKISLVLLDRMMPMVAGDDLLPIIKSTFKDLPVVIITAESSEESRKASLENGASGYLTKPIQIDRLVELAKELAGE